MHELQAMNPSHRNCIHYHLNTEKSIAKAGTKKGVHQQNLKAAAFSKRIVDQS